MVSIHSLDFGYAGRVRCEAGWNLDTSWAERLRDCDLWVTEGGRGWMELRDRRIELVAGVCLWMRPGGRYLAGHDPAHPLVVSAIHFTPKDARGRKLLRDDQLPAEVYDLTDLNFFCITMDRIIRLIREAEAPHSRASPASFHAAKDFMLGLLRLLQIERGTQDVNASSRYRTTIQEQVAAIHASPGEAPDVATLARALSISPDHYTRQFRLVTGRSPRELIQEARHRRAKRLLAESSLSISEIADELGYSDVFQFSRLFKRQAGLPPTRWRARLGSNQVEI